MTDQRSDQVFVSGLALHAYHGVMQHEAKVGQTFKLDLALDIDLAEASRSDKLAHTVGYDQVVEVASEAFCRRRYRLVEAAAGAVAQHIDGAIERRADAVLLADIAAERDQRLSHVFDRDGRGRSKPQHRRRWRRSERVACGW